jgi:hypothetical protein
MVIENIPLPQDGVQILVIAWLVNKKIPPHKVGDRNPFSIINHRGN